MIPRATYRVQFSKHFTFDDAAAITPYLRDLGISHLYASPWLAARPGSTHHYDIVDYNRIDEELGGEAGFARLTEALQANGIGHIMDFVPNHMGVGFADNEYWLDVLKYGPESKYARWFDIDWTPGKLLVPMLGGQYGEELDRGVFTLQDDSIWAYETHRLPLHPLTIPSDDLHILIEQQHWRPAHFRVAADDINYRRFFNINELAGIRMESPEVFEETHRLVFQLIHSGKLQGLRIDHVDGLYDPREYLERVRERNPELYIVVEKILARHESLPEWPVAGTTGYDFCAEVTGLLIDPSGEAGMTRVYQDFTGRSESFAEVLRHSKIHVIRNELAGELQTVARHIVAGAQQDPRTRDFTQNVISRALEAIAASFPVYRTYVDSGGASEQDLRDLKWAVQQARALVREIDPTVFDYLFKLLTGELPSAVPSAMRFQQYTGPVMAKGLEDTALYRHVRLLALNDVGSRPDQFGLSPAGFHHANSERRKRWPASMLSTSTHDSKFGEDVRARLAVLSEIPEEWERQINAWSRLLRTAIGGLEGDAPPDRNDEYLLYQLLLGTWLEPSEEYVARIKQAMTKAMREAKAQTSWIAVNEAYESAVFAFVDRVFTNRAFLGLFEPFAQQIAQWGRDNSLVQTVLKLTCPGVPDIYQGSEVDNLSLMDPDNRRPVQWGDSPKLQLTRELLQRRRRDPDLFAEGTYQQLAVQGELADYVVAFERRLHDRRLFVACARFPARRSRAPWGDTTIENDLRAEELFRDVPYAVLD